MAGAGGFTLAGTVKVTLRVVPTTVVTAVAGVVTVAFASVPAAVGLRVTVTLAGRMVPAGKLAPVRPITVTPGSADVGDGVGVRVTATGD